MQNLFKPFGELNKKTKAFITIFWVVLAIFLFEKLHSAIIPPPSKIFGSFVKLIDSKEFYEDLTTSLLLTIKAMGFSILATMGFVYMSRIPILAPIAYFVSKCRYLTLTGLVFVFTVISANVSELKLSLLLFGIIPFFTTSFLSAIESIAQQEVQKGYVNKLGRWGTLKEIVIIGKMDVLFEVMRQNFAISWMMITMVEGYAMSEGGIGTMLIKSNKYLDLSMVFAMLLIVLILGLIFDYLLSQLRYFLFTYLKPNWKTYFEQVYLLFKKQKNEAKG